MTQDIDVSKLSAEGAARLRALFEATASTARQGGGEAEEAFLIGLAGLMDSYLKQRIDSTGEAMPKPVAIDRSGIISTEDLTAADALRGAQFLLASGERFQAEGHERIAGFLVSVSEFLAKALEQKVVEPGGAIH